MRQAFEMGYVVGRHFERQKYIPHHSCDVRDQSLGRRGDKRKVVRTRASVDRQRGQRV